jgi:hypothetical protein
VEAIPLSLEQQNALTRHKLRLWWYTFHADLPDPVDVEALQRAVTLLVTRHDALRLRLSGRDGDWLQTFADPPESALHVENVASGALSDHWSHLDVESEGPFRATLARYGGTNRLLVSAHHLAWDAWSYYVWRTELASAHAAFVAGAAPPLPELRTSFRAHVERQLAAGSDLSAAQREHWSRIFDGDWPFSGPGGPPGAAGPSSAPAVPGAVADERWGSRHTGALAGDDRRRLSAVAQAARVTTATVALALVALALGAAYERDDILLHVAHHGRDRRELQELVGVFNRSVPLRVRILPGEPLGGFLPRLGRDLRDAIRHSEAPFSSRRLLEHLGRDPSSRVSSFGVNLGLSRRPSVHGAAAAAGGRGVGAMRMRSWTPRPHQLWLDASTEPEWVVSATYDRHHFADEPVERFAAAFGCLGARTAPADLDVPLGRLLQRQGTATAAS